MVLSNLFASGVRDFIVIFFLSGLFLLGIFYDFKRKYGKKKEKPFDPLDDPSNDIYN